MKLFVTGGTGFIGSHFIKQALSAGHDIVALRRPGAALKIQLEKEPTWIEGNLNDDWGKVFESCDALVHLAAQGVSPQPTNWNTAIEVNVRQSISLVHLALTSGISSVVACGSCLEYGASGERFDYIPVTAPLEPTGPYATSKAMFSIALGALARDSDTMIQLLRPFHLYGEGQHESNFWPSLRKAAIAGQDFPMTSGEQIRDFVPVEDVARQFLKACSEPLVPGNPHIRNIGSGNPQTLRQFAEYWWKHWEASGKLKFGELPYRVGEVMRYAPKI
jgi:nucleoside-diphosphate-sugar epimerase